MDNVDLILQFGGIVINGPRWLSTRELPNPFSRVKYKQLNGCIAY